MNIVMQKKTATESIKSVWWRGKQSVVEKLCRTETFAVWSRRMQE